MGDEERVLYPPADLSEAEVRTTIESALKRASPGFLKVIGFWFPPAEQTQDPFTGQVQEPLSTWQELYYSMTEEYTVRVLDLSSGSVPSDVDVLVAVAPQGLSDTERYAIDQYLMRGGAVVTVAGNYVLTPDPYGGGLAVKEVQGGLQDMLAQYGLTVERSMVLDLQNEPFPLPVVRNVGGIQVREIQALDYPFFVDVRSDGMASDHPIVSQLQAVTLNWPSPITVDESKNAQREVAALLKSSANSWTQSTTDIQPNFDLYPQLGFAVGEVQGPQTIAVAVRGAFESYFKDKPSPLVEAESAEGEGEAAAQPQGPVTGTIERSPESARLVVFGSAAFLDDVVFQVSTTLSRDRYLNSLQLIQNAVAWCTEDMDLLTIRARGSTVRLLNPLSERTQTMWEIANYVVALAALATIAVVWNMGRKGEKPMELLPPEQVSTLWEVR